MGALQRSQVIFFSSCPRCLAISPSKLLRSMATSDRRCLFLRQLPGGTHLEQVARFERRGRIVCDKQGNDRKGWASRLSVRLRHITIERKHFVRLGFGSQISGSTKTVVKPLRCIFCE